MSKLRNESIAKKVLDALAQFIGFDECGPIVCGNLVFIKHAERQEELVFQEHAEIVYVKRSGKEAGAIYDAQDSYVGILKQICLALANGHRICSSVENTFFDFGKFSLSKDDVAYHEWKFEMALLGIDIERL